MQNHKSVLSTINAFHFSSRQLVDDLQEQIRTAVDKISNELNELEAKRYCALMHLT